MTNASRIEHRNRPDGQSAILACVAVLLGAGVLAAPLAFGATEVWAYCSLQVLVAIALVLWGLSRDKTWQQMWLPLAVVLLGTAQLIPLPGALLERAAPLCFEARQKIGPLVDSSTNGTISVDAAHTLAALRRCLMLALVVVVVTDLAQVDRYRQWLIRCVAVVGAIILFLGLAVGAGSERKALGFHEMDGYWKTYKNPLLSGFHSIGMGYADEVTVGPIHYVSNSPISGRAFGAMINANHFAVCVGLTLPVVIGVLLALADSSRSMRPFVLTVAGGYALAATYAIAVAAQARAGLAATCATAVVVACLTRSPTRKGVALTTIGLGLAIAGAATATYWIGGTKSFGGRAETWQAAIEMFQRSPWFGVGLGNYATVYPALRSGAVAYLAHSAWLETAAEAGVAGLGLLAAGIGWATSSAGRIWNWNISTSQRRMRSGVLGALLFAALHGAVDHGVQIPANAYLCAVLVGIMVGEARSDRGVSRSKGNVGRWLSPSTMLLSVGFAGLLIGGATREINADWLMMPLRRAVAMQRVPENIHRLDPKPELLQSALPDAVRAFEIKPHEATFADYLGQAFLHLSQGRPGPQLRSADDWLRRSLQLCPVNPWTEKTLKEIRDVANSPDASTPDEPRRRERRRRPTSARLDRSEP